MSSKLKRKHSGDDQITNIKGRNNGTERSRKQTLSIKEKVDIPLDAVKQTQDTTEEEVGAHTDAEKYADDTDTRTNEPFMIQTDALADKIKGQVETNAPQTTEPVRTGGAPTTTVREVGDNSISLSQIEAYKEDPIWVKGAEDEQDCYITGISVLDDGRLVITDGWNRNIKLFDRSRQFVSSYSLPQSTCHSKERGPCGVASTRNNDIFVIFYRSVKRLQLKNNQFSDKGTLYSKGDWIRCITAHEECVFILTQMQGGIKYLQKLDFQGHSLWVVPVEKFASFNVSGQGYHLTSYCHEGKVNVLLSGCAKGKVDGESGGKLETEQVNFVGPVSYGRRLVYFCHYDSNEILALIPNTLEKKLLIKLPNGRPDSPCMGTRGRPLPLRYHINCLAYNPKNEQILVSYEHNIPARNYVVCIQLKLKA